MAEASEYRSQAQRITSPFSGNLRWNEPAQAKQLLASIRQAQKELRLIKKNINLDMKAIRSEYQTARTGVGKSFGSGVAAGVFGRKTMGKVNAATRDNLKRQQEKALQPYEEAKTFIDHAILQLDKVKIQIEQDAG